MGNTRRGGGRGGGRVGGRKSSSNVASHAKEAPVTTTASEQEEHTAHAGLDSEEQQLEEQRPRSEGEMVKVGHRRPTLPPPLNTRPSNRTAHPGAIAAPATRRSSEVVQAERLRLQELQAEAELQQSAAVSRVAELEDQMALRDAEQSMYAHHPRTATDLPPRQAHTRALTAMRERGDELSDSQHEQSQGDAFNLYSLVCRSLGPLIFYVSSVIDP